MRKYNIFAALLALLILTPAAYAANADNPDGCKPTGLFGQFSEPFQPFEAAASQTIAEGDPVKLDGSGQVIIGTATDSSLLGFARTGVSGSSAGDLIYVYSDPKTVFQCQCSGTFAITMVGSAVDLEGSTGAFEVNENATTYKPVRIVGYNASDSVGANTRVYVRLVMASLGNASSGTADDFEVLDDLTVGGDATVTGAVQGGTVTDGTATLDGSGNLSGVADLTITGDFTLGGHKDGQIILSNSFIGVDTNVSINEDGYAAVAASQTSEYVLIGLPGLKIGDEVISFRVLGALGSGGNNTVIDAKLRKATKNAGAAPTVSDVGAITQVDVTANTALDAEKALVGPEIISADFQYFVWVEMTTGAGCTATITGVEIDVNRK